MPSVLIVDDERDIRTIVGLSLEGDGFDVRAVESGLAALEALESDPPDAMLVDIMMPGMDGFELLTEMRERGIAPRTRVVIMTCRTSGRDHLRGWELGADDYFTKPFDPTALIVRLRELLGTTTDELAQRRTAELEKAALFDRLETLHATRRRVGARV
jgi:DNA-binding response OmpR family regulator